MPTKKTTISNTTTETIIGIKDSSLKTRREIIGKNNVNMEAFSTPSEIIGMK